MERIYIENDNARITRQASDHRLTVELYSGEVWENMEARRLFPITGTDRYISLLDDTGTERAIIRDLSTLMPESRAAVQEALAEYYLIPKILSVREIGEKFGTIRIRASTDRGDCSFEINNRSQGIKMLYDGRILLRDTNDNRYEVENIRMLDRKSLDILLL